ncbi:insulin receptor substrate 1-like [Panonychus citri]|uniref:insulin receptor substrate 1-like n=1 Tax=Panonychus citri TaxID=50023 RepID=UPI002306F6D2|nr:insulin receptor substrate 1-like [Panonychus citri]
MPFILKACLLKYKRTKSIKERFFVLHSPTPISAATTTTITSLTSPISSTIFPSNGSENGKPPARLEYYESERKFRSGSPCKASIILKDCFNISRKHGTKETDHIMFIFTKEDCYTFYFDDERNLLDWFTLLIELTEIHLKSSRYQRVWQVTLPKNQNTERENLTGTYRLCLTNDKKLHLVKVAPNELEPILHELPLSCVRRFSHNKKYFIVELGRGAAIGAGNLCMLTDDGATTHDIHESILRVIDYQPTFTLNKVSTNGSLQNLRTPIHHSVYDSETTLRPRSASTSECCRPISFRGRRISRENTIGGGMSNPQPIPIGIPINGGSNGCSSHSSGQSSQSHSLTSPGSYYDNDEMQDDGYVPMKPLDLSSSEALELSVNSYKSSIDSPTIFNASSDLSPTTTGILRH